MEAHKPCFSWRVSHTRSLELCYDIGLLSLRTSAAISPRCLGHASTQGFPLSYVWLHPDLHTAAAVCCSAANPALLSSTANNGRCLSLPTQQLHQRLQWLAAFFCCVSFFMAIGNNQRFQLSRALGYCWSKSGKRYRILIVPKSSCSRRLHLGKNLQCKLDPGPPKY